MSDSIFKLEEQIMQAWNVIDDINLLYHHFGDHPKFAGLSAGAEDEMANLMLGITSMYQLKFEKLFHTFEEVTKEYHSRGHEIADQKRSILNKVDEITELKQRLNDAQSKARNNEWPEDTARVDAIGQNGNDGLHYGKE